MEKNESKQFTPQKRTLIFLCLVVSGIASSPLSTAMTTALPNLVESFGVSAGLMIDAFGWKSIFYLVLVIMSLSFVISCFVFEDVLELQDKKFDVLSFVESIFAFGGITLGIGNISSFGLISLQAGLPLAVDIVVCVLFVIRQCGLVTLPGSLATAVVSPFAGKLYDNHPGLCIHCTDRRKA